ncbi:MAG: outer-membrane lipoprotein carrier protein LolA [Xanthobacteraceae bacterium]
MTRTVPAALLGSFLLGLICSPTLLSAQTPTVPVPTPAPPQRSGTAAPAKPTAAKSTTDQSPSSAIPRPPNPVGTPSKPSGPAATAAKPPGADATTDKLPAPNIETTNTLNADQRALLDRISNYLSSVHTMVGKFVQVGPDGGKTTGDFFLQKPGKVRFQYDPPAPTEIVADGQSVAVRDRNLNTQDVYELSQTPLRFLLADHIDIINDTNLVAMTPDDNFVSVVIEERNLVAGTYRLMVMFGAKDLQLKQWTITDPQGYDTTVAIYNLDTAKRPDPDLFRITYERADHTIQ